MMATYDNPLYIQCLDCRLVHGGVVVGWCSVFSIPDALRKITDDSRDARLTYFYSLDVLITIDHGRRAKEFDCFTRHCTERYGNTDRCCVCGTDDARDFGLPQRFAGVSQRGGRSFARVSLSPRPRR